MLPAGSLLQSEPVGAEIVTEAEDKGDVLERLAEEVERSFCRSSKTSFSGLATLVSSS